MPDSRRPSLTAGAVALGRAIGTGELHDPLAARALPGVGRPLAVGARRLARLPGGGVLASVALGGLNVHASLRMAAVDQAVIAAVADGVGQVVVVGAGFDTRAWRLEALRGRRVVELDLPATQRRKRRVMADVTPLADVEHVAADLAHDSLVMALAPTSWNPVAPTVWVWEAVAPYLSPAAVRVTATQLADLSAPGSHLIMTFAHPVGRGGVLGAVAEGVVGLGFRAIGEPLRSAHDDWDMTALLDEAGFTDMTVTGGTEWARATGLPARRLPFAPERLITAVRL